MILQNIVYIIIIANVLFSLQGFNDRYFFEKYKFQIGPIKAGQQIRMLSSGFLHVDYMHLGLNMYVLYMFGPVVIAHIGVSKFLIIYFGSLLFGSLFTLNYHKNNHAYSAVGASGAVAGVIYAAIMLRPEMTLIMFPLPIPLPAYVFGIGYLLYTIYGMKKQLGNIGHAAHLGGTIGGFALTLLLYPSIFSENKMMTLLLGIPIVLLLFFEKKLRL